MDNIIEDVKDLKEMGIYERLGRMQYDLSQVNFQKSGHNQFGNFDYSELDDLQPEIIKCLYKYHCTLQFNFIDGIAYLDLVSWENEDDVIHTQLPMPKLEKMPKMNLAQSEGAYETYFKRYLLRNLFMLSSKEEIDAMDNTKDYNAKPKCLNKVIERYKEKSSKPLKSINQLNNTRLIMFKAKELTPSENEELYKYIKAGGEL